MANVKIVITVIYFKFPLKLLRTFSFIRKKLCMGVLMLQCKLNSRVSRFLNSFYANIFIFHFHIMGPNAQTEKGSENKIPKNRRT